MPAPIPFPIRQECPPGACICERDRLLRDPQGDVRVLRLTRLEERKLIERIENSSSFADLQRIRQRMQDQLGIELWIAPGLNEVRTVRGLQIRLTDKLGLCRKIRQSIPAAVRRCLEKKPEIVYAILDAHDLLEQTRQPPT
ncbi:MAG: hypothetical protein JSS58_09100 [Proteobacteria bacterium]|nr:hypothetical protein [Pseudomonadota bacterium]